MRLTCSVLFLFLLAACSANPGQDSLPAAPSSQPTRFRQATETQPAAPHPTWTRPVLSTATDSPTEEPEPAQASTPLEGISLDDLPEIVTNPFKAPYPGQDDGHHGTDFAFFRFGQRGSILGLGVKAVFPGRIAAVVADRPPYGNMVMVETAFGDLPVDLMAALDSLPPLPTAIPGNIRLTCPPGMPSMDENSPKSLYLLYAHLEKAPAAQTGDPVYSGQQLGTVGNSGVSSNPHLHLEARIGPSGTTFAGMAHYIASASPDEMAGYCSWRVSGAFRLIDPMQLLASHK